MKKNKKPTILKISGLEGLWVGEDHATRGTDLHRTVSENYPSMNTGKGADFPQLDAELKTKDIDSRSAYSIASMTIDYIKNTEYDKSIVNEKLQQLINVPIRFGVVLKEEVYDFRPQWIQAHIKEAYNNAREMIIQGNCGTYVRNSKYGYFEKITKRKNQYQFRIPISGMNALKSMARSQLEKLSIFEIK